MQAGPRPLESVVDLELPRWTCPLKAAPRFVCYKTNGYNHFPAAILPGTLGLKLIGVEVCHATVLPYSAPE